MNWSATRIIIYVLGLALSTIATFAVARGWATYDSATNMLDPAPIDLGKLAASAAGMLASGTATFAWLKNLSRK
jgi:hypothetical protein